MEIFLYNGMTFEEVQQKINLINLHEVDKKIYLQNVKEYIKLKDTNINYKECILNSNFNIINNFLKN